MSRNKARLNNAPIKPEKTARDFTDPENVKENGDLLDNALSDDADIELDDEEIARGSDDKFEN